MASRIVTLTHLIPSISPWNVWDLPLYLWLSYARWVDQYEAEVKKSREGR